MNYKNVKDNWKAFYDAINKIGGQCQFCEIGAPATIDEIQKLETDINIPLPKDLKEVLLDFSGAVNYSWFLPDNFKLPDELSSIFCGDRHWSIEKISQINNDKNDCCEFGYGYDYQDWFPENGDESHVTVYCAGMIKL